MLACLLAGSLNCILWFSRLIIIVVSILEITLLIKPFFVILISVLGISLVSLPLFLALFLWLLRLLRLSYLLSGALAIHVHHHLARFRQRISGQVTRQGQDPLSPV